MKGVIVFHHRTDRTKTRGDRERAHVLVRVVEEIAEREWEFPIFAHSSTHWTRQVQWTCYQGNVTIRGKRQSVVAFAPDGEKPTVWAASINGLLRASDYAGWQWANGTSRKYSRAAHLAAKHGIPNEESI